MHALKLKAHIDSSHRIEIHYPSTHPLCRSAFRLHWSDWRPHERNRFF